jgi:hypothetical protein
MELGIQPSRKEVRYMVDALDDPKDRESAAEASGAVKGPECPTCGDRFPSKETLQEHIDEAHKLTG